MAGWPGALERIVDEVLREASRRGVITGGLAAGGVTAAGAAAAARPWLDLAAAAGPTPAEGPLLHDVLLPGGGGFGVIVFGHREEQDLLGAAERWAAASLGRDTAAAIAELGRAAGPGAVMWSAGFRVGPGGIRLKLYASARPGALALKKIGRAIGLSTVGAASSLGVDGTRAGLERARTYLTLPGPTRVGGAWGASASHEPVPGRRAVAARARAEAKRGGRTQATVGAALRGLDAWWEGAGEWLDSPPPAGVSHRLLASLGRRTTRGGKRALVHIFGPQAPLDALLAADEAAGELAGARCLDPEWLHGLAASVAAAGLTLRPVAHEIDLHADGRRAADAFVTVAAPARA